MPGDSVPRAPKVTTKQKAKAKLGKRIFKERQVKRIKRSKLEKSMKRAAENEQPKGGSVLLRSEAEGARGSGTKPLRGSSYTGRMDVDEFMDGGFEQTMEELEGEDDDEEEDKEEEVKEAPASAPAAKGKRSKAAQHAADLAALEKSDPDFYNFLKETDQNLLAFEGEEDEDEDEDDEDDEDEKPKPTGAKAAAKRPTKDAGKAAPQDEDDEDDEDEDNEAQEQDEDDEDDEMDDEDDEEVVVDHSKAKAAPAPKPIKLIEVTSAMVKTWQQTLESKQDTRTLKEAVSAFRAAVRFGDASDAQRDDVFTFTSGGVFNQLMQLCLSSMDEVLRRHVAGGAAAVAAGAKTRAGLDRPDAWAHWRKHQPLVKSYLTHLLQFAGQLSEASMIAVTLQQMHRLLPFYFCLPKLCPKLLKATLRVWAAPPGEAGGAQQNTLLGFAIIRQLACSLPYPFVEHCLKGLYLAYAQASSRTNRVTLQHLVLLSSCVVDMCAVDAQAAYRHAFVYIRQLAIHLRNAIQKATPEATRQVYNWQYVNCLRVWAQVLCAHARSSSTPLRQLVYPLVQVTLGTARLLPSIRYSPLRFQCCRILNQLCAELGIYVRRPNAPLPSTPCVPALLPASSSPRTAQCLRSLNPMSGPLTSTAHTTRWLAQHRT